MVDTTNFNIDENFWELNPTFKACNPFKKLHTSDKSRNKVVSSNKMWCIALIWDRDSMYFNLPEEGEDNKIDMIFEEFYGDAKWLTKNRPEFEELSAFYRKLTETPTMRAFKELEDKLDERAEFLRNTKYDLGLPNDKGVLVGGTADLLEKMFSNTDKIFKTVEATRKLVLDEKSKVTKGDVTESASDSGKI